MKYAFEPVLRPKIWQSVPDWMWQDWHWQQQNRIRTLDQLQRVIALTEAEIKAFHQAAEKFRVAISPYYASLMAIEDSLCPIRQQAVPQEGELTVDESEWTDPLGEEAHSPVPGLVHRYPDRALLYVTHHCAVYCRHCTRKRKVSRHEAGQALAGAEPLERALEYLRHHEEIRDVILSGGDPLSLSDDRLVEIVEKVAAIDHVEMIRIGTRNLVTLPQRITSQLLERLAAAFQPIYFQTHFNHPRECTLEAKQACAMVANAGFPVSNQTVLLKGVNDDASTLKELNHRLLMMRVRPYLLLQCDLAEGIKHFRTPIEKGVELIHKLRGWTSGLAIPHFVVDTSPGGGKVSMVPNYVDSVNGKTWTFKNYRGELTTYEDP